MKVATWNVNGIRAREAQLCDWLERDQPDVVCLQEIKARPDQVPERCKLAHYHAFWHGGGGYSGVSLHLRRELLEVPEFSHPEFDIETRIVQVALGNLVLASVYVPNGGKDYPAKLGFLSRLAVWAKQLHDEGRELILCGDINIARADIDVHPRERKPGVIGQRLEERELFEMLLRRPLGACQRISCDIASGRRRCVLRQGRRGPRCRHARRRSAGRCEIRLQVARAVEIRRRRQARNGRQLCRRARRRGSDLSLVVVA